MKCLILILIVFMGFLNLVGATIFDIGSDENNLTTFTFNSLVEKIEIDGNVAHITNLFHFNIDTNALNQNLHFSLSLPSNDGRNLFVSSFEYLACGSQLAHKNSVKINSPENDEWTLNCGEYEPEEISRNSVTHVSNSIFLKGIPLGEEERNNDRVGIYIQVKYSLQNYVIENDGEYEYIPIERFQTSKPYVNFEDSHGKIILVMPSGTILEEKSNFNLKKVGKNGEIVLEYKNPKENSFITFRDSKKQNSRAIVRDYSIVAITFSVAIIMLFLGRRFNKSSDKFFNSLLIALGLSSFIFGFSYINGNYILSIWGLIATLILSVSITAYLTISEMINEHKKQKEKKQKEKINSLPNEHF